MYSYRLNISAEAEQADGLLGGYDGVSAEVGFRAGSYSGYNEWRAILCRMAHGVDPAELWDNPEKYKGKPFFELINFSDWRRGDRPENEHEVV